MQRNFAMPAQPPRPAAEQLGRAWAEPGLRSAAPPEVYIAPDENAPFPAGRSTLYREYLMKKSGLWESDCLVHGYPETWALPAGRPIEPVGRPPSDDGATDTGAGATDAQPSPTTGHTNASNNSANQGGGSGRLSPNATRAAHDDAEREAETKQRRIAATPEGHLSLRMCPRYGAMMGATSVSKDEIAKTTREYDPTFEGIDSDDPNSMLYATQLLTRIELTAATHSLTMKECKGIATEHGPQHKRAEAAGKLIHTVSQWAAADSTGPSDDRQKFPHMPTLLGGAAAPAAAGGRKRHDEEDAPDDDAAATGHATTEDEYTRMEREQREQEAEDWRQRVDTRERQIEEHAFELQRQLQEQQLTRHKQQQERQQQQDETDALEQRRQQLIEQRRDLEKLQQNFTRDFQQQLLQQQAAQQHPAAPPAQATAVPQGGQPHTQQYTAQSQPSAFNTQHQTHTQHHGQAAPPPPGPPPNPWAVTAAATPHASLGGPPVGAPPPAAATLPTRVAALMTGTAAHEWAQTLMTMAGAVPGSTIQIDLLRLMSTEDVSYIVEGFLTKAGQTADSCRPPAGVKAFQHFWSIASKYTNEREERKDSVSAQNHAGKSAGKLLEKSTSEAAHAPTHTASASVYSDPATIAALKQFAGTKKITNVDAVLATVPAPARAILMAKFDTDNGTVLTADGQEAKRGALFLVTEVLPKRAQRVLRTNPHCPEMSFTDRENMSKHVTQALFATKAAIWTFVQTPRGTKPLKSWEDWIQHANNTPVTWAEDTANAIDLFVSVVTATHGYGAQATGPADADATKADDDDKSKSLLIGTTHNQRITYEMNWSWLGPWMEAFTSLSTTVRNSTVTANERKVVINPDMIMGATDKILRILVDAFVAAVANGQRYGTPVEYEQLTKQHYTGEGEGLHASIMRFKTASNPLMHDIMQDMFRSVLEGSKQAHLQHATPAAAQAGSGRRQTQQQQQQAAAPLQAQLLHAQQQLQLQQQQRQQPPPATSPAPAPAAASPAQAEPPAWLMQPPPWWASSPPTPGAATDRDRQTQQPPHDQQRNDQHNPHQHQGNPAFKAGMLPPGQQPRPPPIPPVLGRIGAPGKGQFMAKGETEERYNPFAAQFGGTLRDEMTQIYNSDIDPEKTAAKARCRPVMSAVRKAAGLSNICDKWITTGRCREPGCKGTHPDWDPTWNGQWLHARCPELAAMARVPPDWAP